jgi:NitT/TauT family transport system permease protein/putative hydroxymethylpyrimidine transport system permease protein
MNAQLHDPLPPPRARRRFGSVLRSRLLGDILAPTVLVIALVGAWELYVQAGNVDRFVLPAPHAVANELWESAPLLWANFKITAEEVLLGLALALFSGFAIAVAVHFSPLLRRSLYPLAVGSQAVPIPVIAAALIFWWGFGLFPKLFVIALICFFPVLVSTVDGLASVDREQLKLLRTLDASRWQAFRFAELPAALPAALSGARIALAVGVIGAFIAETSTATTGPYAGLGHEIVADGNALQVSRQYAATVVLFAFALACFYTLALLERKLRPWTPRAHGAHL